MLYTSIFVKDKEYKARLTTKAIIELERKLKTNPVNALIEMGREEGKLPNLEVLLTFLHASLQSMEHGISLEDTYEIYDEMVEDGKNFTDLLNIIVKVFQDSGLLPKDEEMVKNAKRGK